MRLGRYALYGILLAFTMYLAGALYRHYTINADVLNQNIVPLVLWGVFAGAVGGAFVMGLETLASLIKMKWQTKRKP